MSAFYFGSSDRPLFGYYHPPSERPVRRAGVLLCNALGREYLRTHRTLRQLSIRLSEAGYHVLRFDYSGTGDSAGAGEEATLRRWEEDAGRAAEELKAVAGVRRVTLAGVRLGAAVATALASERSDVEDLVLWDPAVRGDRYLEALLEGRAPSPADVVGAGGFPVGAAMRRQVAELRLDEIDDLRARRALLVTTEEDDGYRAFGRRIGDLVPEARTERRSGAEGWEDPGRMGTVVLVPAIVGTIVEFLEAGR